MIVLPFALGKCSCASTFHNNTIIGKGVLTLAINLIPSDFLPLANVCAINLRIQQTIIARRFKYGHRGSESSPNYINIILGQCKHANIRLGTYYGQGGMHGWLAGWPTSRCQDGRSVDSVACESPLNCAMNLLFDKLSGLLLFCSLSEARLLYWTLA